jgi:glycosyltransferase involved in cell wall biosynthesis
MAQALVTLLNDEPLRGRMGQAGLARVRERFTAERMIEETVAAYEEVLARRPQSVPGEA